MKVGVFAPAVVVACFVALATLVSELYHALSAWRFGPGFGSAGIALDLEGELRTVRLSRVSLAGFAAVDPSEILDQSLADGTQSSLAGMEGGTSDGPVTLTRTVELRQRESIAAVLRRAGLSGAEAQQIQASLRGRVDTRTMRAGDEIRLEFRPETRGVAFAALSFEPEIARFVTVTRVGNDYRANIIDRPLVTRSVARQGTVLQSLGQAARDAGIPGSLERELGRLFAVTVDLQRDLRRGDTVRVLYEGSFTEDGRLARAGGLTYAALTVGGRERELFAFRTRDGRLDWYAADGRSIRRALMRTPVDGARMSSGFGMRRHPILGYSRMHKGVDFAAPAGTPVYAAGDGTIEMAGRLGSYGNYVRLRHSSEVQTAYAHLRGFAPGIVAGRRVVQGQVIGYVGSTGQSTGPHLHFEVLRGGVQVNPGSLSLPTATMLAGEDAERFRLFVEEQRRRFNEQVDRPEPTLVSQTADASSRR